MSPAPANRLAHWVSGGCGQAVLSRVCQKASPLGTTDRPPTGGCGKKERHADDPAHHRGERPAAAGLSLIGYREGGCPESKGAANYQGHKPAGGKEGAHGSCWKEGRLLGDGAGQAKVADDRRRGDATARGALQVPLLDQVRFDHLFNGVGGFTDCRGKVL